MHTSILLSHASLRASAFTPPPAPPLTPMYSPEVGRSRVPQPPLPTQPASSATHPPGRAQLSSLEPLEAGEPPGSRTAGTRLRSGRAGGRAGGVLSAGCHRSCLLHPAQPRSPQGAGRTRDVQPSHAASLVRLLLLHRHARQARGWVAHRGPAIPLSSGRVHHGRLDAGGRSCRGPRSRAGREEGKVWSVVSQQLAWALQGWVTV